MVVLFCSAFANAGGELGGSYGFDSELPLNRLELTPLDLNSLSLQDYRTVTCYTDCNQLNSNPNHEVQITVFYSRKMMVSFERVRERNCNNEDLLTEPPVCDELIGM